jgi:hypothetical protein
MQVLYRQANLVDVALHLQLVQALAATEQLVERLVLTQLQKDVDILSVLEEMLEADDMVLVEGAMDLDLGHKLLFGPGFSECGLHNDFGCLDTLILQVRELEAASEAALSEELAFEVLFDADFAVVLDDFLLDDGLSVFDALLLGITLLHRELNNNLS